MAVLLLADHNNKVLGAANAKAMTAATALGGEVHVLVAGADCKGVAEAAAKLGGATKVLLVESPQLAQCSRRRARRAHRAADGQLRRPGLRGDGVRQERAPARRRATRRDAALRHHQGCLARYLRAPNLRGQRHPDRAVAGRQEGHYGAHRIVSGRRRRRIGVDRNGIGPRRRRFVHIREGRALQIGPPRADGARRS